LLQSPADHVVKLSSRDITVHVNGTSRNARVCLQLIYPPFVSNLSESFQPTHSTYNFSPTTRHRQTKMPSIKLIIKANSNPIFESIPCGDAVHGELVHTCRHPDKVLIFHRNKPAGLFVHVGCKSINLTQASWLNDSEFAKLKCVLEEQPDVCACDGSVVFRSYADANSLDRKEYRRIEELVGKVLSEKSSRKPPPAPRLMPADLPPLFVTRNPSVRTSLPSI
jgi:hypothetical protein